LEADESSAREDEAPPPAVDGGEHGARKTRQFVGDYVADLASPLIENDDAAAVSRLLGERCILIRGRAASYLHYEQVPFHHRRAADAKEIGHDAEVGEGIDAPERLAIVGAEAMQHPFDAVGVNAIVIDNRAAARTVVVAVAIFVMGGIFKLPERL